MKNRLKSVGDSFKAKYQILPRGEFYGQVLEIPDTARVTNFLSPRRYLRVGTEVENVIATTVVLIDGVKYIVAEHGTGFYQEPIYRHFKLFEVDLVEDWYKVSKEKNAVTGVNETTRILQPEPVYLATQPKALVEDSIHIQQQTYIAVSNVKVNRNDVVGNRIVTRVDHVLGCWLLELKEE